MPSVTTKPVIYYDQVTATLSAEGVSGNPDQKGFVISDTQSTPTVLNATVITDGGSGDDDYDDQAEDLTAATLYYFRAWILILPSSYTYGSVLTFTTLSEAGSAKSVEVKRRLLLGGL